MAESGKGNPQTEYADVLLKKPEYKLEHYEAFAVQGYLMNMIWRDSASFGFPSGSLRDSDVDNYVFDHFDELVKKFHLEGQLNAKSTKLLTNRNEYDKILGMSKYFAQVHFGSQGGDDKRLPPSEIIKILQAQQTKVDSFFTLKNKLVSGTPEEMDADGKSTSGALYRQLENAIEQENTMKQNLRYKRRGYLGSLLKTTLSAVAGIGCLALTFSTGGAALGALAGTTAALGGLGTSVIGIVGSVISGKFFFNAIDKLKQNFISWRQHRLKLKEFRKGIGAFKSLHKDGVTKYRGLKQIKKQYYIVKAINEWKKEGGKLTGKNRRYRKYLRMALKSKEYGFDSEEELKKKLKEYIECFDGNVPGGFRSILNRLNELQTTNVKDNMSVSTWQDIIKNHPERLIMNSIPQFERVQAIDKKGNPMFDQNGSPIYEVLKDKKGNPILDKNGNPQYVEREVAPKQTNKTLEEIVQTIAHLKSYEKDFESNQESMMDYKKAMVKLDGALLKAIENQLLDEPYTSSSLSKIETMMEKNPIIKERFSSQDSILYQQDQRLKNELKFAGFDMNPNGVAGFVDPVSEDLGIGINSQIFIDSNTIKNVCVKSYGADINDPKLKNIIAILSKDSSREELNALTNEINGLNRVGLIKYLINVQEKKLRQTKLSRDDISNSFNIALIKDANVVNSIINDISNLSENVTIVDIFKQVKLDEDGDLNEISEFAKIRKKIFALNEDDEIKKSLLTALANQYLILENKKNLETTANVYKKIRIDACPEFSALVDEASKVDLTINPDKKSPIDEFYKTKISNISDPDIRNYFVNYLGWRVYDSIKMDIDALLPTKESMSIEQLINTLKGVANSKFLTEYQKESLIHEFEPAIKMVMIITQKKYMKNFMFFCDDDLKSGKKNMEIVENLDKGYGKKGLKQYFDLGTAIGVDALEMIKKFKENKNNADIFKIGFGCGKFDELNDPEIRKMSFMLFNRDGKTDSAIQELKNIKGMMGNLTNSQFYCNDPDFSKYQVKDLIIKKLSQIETKNTNNNDKLLYLLQLKRVSMLSFKTFVNEFIKKHGLVQPNIDMDVAFAEEKVDEEWQRVVTAWKTEIASKIDQAIEKVYYDLSLQNDSISKGALDVYKEEGLSIGLEDYVASYTPQTMKMLIAQNSVAVKDR